MFPEPTSNGFFVYSKTKCSYCDKVKQLFNSNQYSYTEIICDDYLLDEKIKESFLSFIQLLTNREYRTFPIVFKDGVFIGGFTDTREYIERLLSFEMNDF
jgi:glutaredoxin